MKKVFVSGCYDILHAGHLQFFEEARALGDYLIVSFASAEVLWHHKRRKPSIPDDHKRALLQGLRMIDEVVVTQGQREGLDFEEDFLRIRPDVLIVTEDDKYGGVKRELCERVGAQYTVLPKTPPRFEPVSTSSIVRWVQAPTEAPLRVDFAGGWLDVPRFSRPGEFVVNCAISPLVSLRVWRSGATPVLDFKRNGDVLTGRMAVLWTGKSHDTPGVANHPRDYGRISESGRIARDGALHADAARLAEGMTAYYQTQLDEGMEPLPVIAGALAHKYCGGGYGGYALYLFEEPSQRARALAAHAMLRAVEPFCRV